MKNIKIGADPELFLAKDGQVTSAEGVIGGTKEEPQPISEDGHAIQEDNVMIEFNIPACTTSEDFVNNIEFVKDYLETMVGLKGYGLDFRASAIFPMTQLRTEQAMRFGCEPDFNVYLGDENKPPESTGDLRCCGGHIHLGYDNPDEETSEKLVLAMDMTLGLESVLLDTDTRRKELYGCAGSFRFKPYGVEYRTLSNFWIASEELMQWAFNKTMEAVELVESGKIEELTKEYSKFVRQAIDTNDKALATTLLENINRKQLATVA